MANKVLFSASKKRNANFCAPLFAIIYKGVRKKAILILYFLTGTNLIAVALQFLPGHV